MVTRHLKHFVASVLLIHWRTLKSLNVYSKAFLFFPRQGRCDGRTYVFPPKLQKSLIILLYCFKVESERLQRVIESGKDRYARTLNLQAQMDERELQQVVDDKRKFLKTAVEYYIKTLQTGVGWKGCMLNSCKLNNCSPSPPLPSPSIMMMMMMVIISPYPVLGSVNEVVWIDWLRLCHLVWQKRLNR